MSLLRNAIKSSVSLQTIKPSHGLPFLLRESPKRLSTETGPAPDASAIDSFIQTPNKGSIYGKITGVTKHTLRSDIINMLEGCDLTPDDVKMSYSRNFTPIGMMVQFPSRNALENAFKVITKKGRLYTLNRVDRYEWDTVMPYNGKTVLLQGIPLNAIVDDVERLLSGCEYDSSSIHVFVSRPENGEPIKMATVRFLSQTEAMTAYLTKNRSFCLNNQILMHVLQ